MKIPHCSENRQEECSKMNSLTFVVLFWYIFHIYISYLYMIYIILLLTCSDVSQWKMFKISSLWAVLGGEVTFWHWFGMKNGLNNPSFLQNINSTFQPGLGMIIFLLLQVFSLIKKEIINVMIYTWVPYIFARLSDGEIASSLLMAPVEMLRNELCLITSFHQESAKIWAEGKQTFPQELHSAPTAWWEPGLTLPAAILPEDVTAVYTKTLRGGQSQTNLKYFSTAHPLPSHKVSEWGITYKKVIKMQNQTETWGHPTFSVLLCAELCRPPALLWSICPKPGHCRCFPATSTAFAGWRWMNGTGHSS